MHVIFTGRPVAHKEPHVDSTRGFRAKPELQCVARSCCLPLLTGSASWPDGAGPGRPSMSATRPICPTRVALGRFDGTNWTSQGWWTMQPRTCAGLLTGPLDARYYYLYASDGAGRDLGRQDPFLRRAPGQIPGPRPRPIAPSAALTAAAFLKWIPAARPTGRRRFPTRPD